MVLQAGLAALLTRLGARQRHSDRQPDCGAHRQRARRSGRVLRQHAGAAHRHRLAIRASRELIGRVRASNLAAYGHQDLPFERLVEVLNPARSLARHPLFQVMLVLQNNAPVQLRACRACSAALSRWRRPAPSSTCRLSLAEQRAADGTPAGIDGRSGIRQRPVRSRERGGAGGPPRAAAGGGGCRSRAGDRRGSTFWRRRAPAASCASGTTPRARSRPRPCRSCSRRRWRRRPDATAVVFEDERLSYRELDARSSRLAHHLRALGVGPEVVVGLCVERSPEMLIGLLGILKAGGAYLPLDPDYPPERLAFMLADARAPVLLTRATLRAHCRPSTPTSSPRCRLARHRRAADNRSGQRPRPAKPRLRHLHLRLHRHTKGRRRHPSECRQPIVRADGGFSDAAWRSRARHRLDRF